MRRLLLALVMLGVAGSYPRLYPPATAGFTRSASNPILTATEAWEQTAVSEVVVHVEDGVWKMWYRGGWGNQGVGYATAPAGSDPTDPASWTKYAGNPVYGLGGSGRAGNDGGEPWVIKIDGTYWLYTTNNTAVPHRVNVATSSDGLAWTTQTSSISFPSGCSLWGNRVVWREGASSWKMLQEAHNGTIWQIYLYTSSDGLSWSIGNSGNPLTTLQVHVGGTYGGPKLAEQDGIIIPKRNGLYEIWYHAVNATGSLPSNIYRATSPDLITWTISPAGAILSPLGSGFEIDQVAGPNVIVVGAKGYLFYDGDDNSGAGSASIGAAVGSVTP